MFERNEEFSRNMFSLVELRACLEVLYVPVSCLTLFTRLHMMHVEFYMHENLTAAGNFNKIFHGNTKFFHATYQILSAKFCHRDKLFISRILHCAH